MKKPPGRKSPNKIYLNRKTDQAHIEQVIGNPLLPHQRTQPSIIPPVNRPQEIGLNAREEAV
jgi:hypothetical protein